MRRLGDADPDSGHPTPREDEHFTDDGSESPLGSYFSPLTSTPIVRNRPPSVRAFFENSERDQTDGEEKKALVASVRQLIETTEKNRRLTKENEKILNESQIWQEVKTSLEKQIKESMALVESLQHELKEKCTKIDLLELRISDLLQSVTEHLSEEVFEASEELVTEKKDAGVQYEESEDEIQLRKQKQTKFQELEDRNLILDSENKQLQSKLENLHELEEHNRILIVENKGLHSEVERTQELEDRNRFLDAENKELQCKLENLHSIVDDVITLQRQLDECQQKCTFLENENLEVRKEEKELLKESAAKAKELLEKVEECARLNCEVETLRSENANSVELRQRNEQLERSMFAKDKLLEELKTQNSNLRTNVASYKREIVELKSNDVEMKRIVTENVAEMKKLKEECAKLQEMSSKLTEENVFSSVLSEELKMRLSCATAESEELRLSLVNERQAREAAEKAARCCSDLEMKLRERSVEVDELVNANEKMSQELEFLRQTTARSSSKEEMGQVYAALQECRQKLEQTVTEKNALLEKQHEYAEQIAKIESLRYELKCRDKIVADLRSAESNLHDALVGKTTEVKELGERLDRINIECDRVREEFHVFQELAERQYCDMIKEKHEQIDALSSRLAQLESYPDESRHTECMKSAKNDGLYHALYDCVPPAVRVLAEKAACDSRSLAEAIKEMRGTFVLKSRSQPTLPTEGFISLTPEKLNAKIQTSLDSLVEDENARSINRLIISIENFRDCQSYPSSPKVQDELMRLLTCAKDEQRSSVIDTAVVRFLKECHQHFADAAELGRQELKAILDDKEILEKRMNTEKLKWSIEREDMQLQLDRYRRQADQLTSAQKERTSMISELNAAKIQIEQFRLKLRKQSEEMETLITERDNVIQFATEMQKLDQESQEELRKANDAIDELVSDVESVRADLEKERREVILLKDENDESSIVIQRLKAQVADLEQRIVDLERCCEKLSKTERYNQKTIEIVCESFWEREEFVQRLRRRSYERKKLIEHFVNKVGEIIASFKGDSNPVDTMQATIKSWTTADDRDDREHESRARALEDKVAALGSGDQLSMAYGRMLNRFKKGP